MPPPPPPNYEIDDLDFFLKIRFEYPRSQRFENAKIFLHTFAQKIKEKVGEIVITMINLVRIENEKKKNCSKTKISK